jgi:hypothetical protein
MSNNPVPAPTPTVSSTANPSRFGRFQARMEARSVRAHAIATAVAVMALGVVNTVLDRLYAASGFPVPYAEGQTSFDGDQVKAWYAEMQQAGTLDVYLGTQLFDYLFMAMVAVTGLLAGSLIVRRADGTGWASGLVRRLGLAVRTLLPVGAAFDAVENLFSFPMLAQPETFPNVWAVAQSTAAVAKFASIGVGLTAALLAVLLLMARAAVRLVTRRSAPLHSSALSI